mmetsp:Transcript_2727/g.6420  ORF Transcript_2727/g.6420 Transcript_2727/m.6420 type:complete len:222 (+) Transcript_2727:1170-1835(+)
MSEMPVVDLMVAKACSKTSMFFWCCLMCLRWMVLRKASLRMRFIMVTSEKEDSSSATMNSFFVPPAFSLCMAASRFFRSSSCLFISSFSSATWSSYFFRSICSCFCIIPRRVLLSSLWSASTSTPLPSSRMFCLLERISSLRALKTWLSWIRSRRMLSIFSRNTLFSWFTAFSLPRAWSRWISWRFVEGSWDGAALGSSSRRSRALRFGGRTLSSYSCFAR